MKKIFFITHFSPKFGIGHLKRCLNISEYFPKAKKYILNLANFKCKKIYKKKIFFKNNFMKLENKNNINIIDVVPTEYYKNMYLFKNLEKKNSIIIDNGFKKKIIFNNSIHPYVSNSKIISKYCGEKYFILNKKIIKIGLRKIKKKKRILICMGGSDIDFFTEKVLKVLVKIEHNYKIDIVIGPYFNKKRIKNIKKIVNYNKNYFFYMNPINLYEIIARSSFAIVNFGNIKFESIFLNTPIILLSNKKHKEICINFSKKFTTLNNDFIYDKHKIVQILQKILFDFNLMNTKLKFAIKNINLSKFNKTINLIKKIHVH